MFEKMFKVFEAAVMYTTTMMIFFIFFIFFAFMFGIALATIVPISNLETLFALGGIVGIIPTILLWKGLKGAAETMAALNA